MSKRVALSIGLVFVILAGILLLNKLLTLPTHNRQIETINRTGEKIQGEQNQISILENLKHQYEEELRAVSYPLYGIGFLSQVTFVITGVEVPFQLRTVGSN